MRRTDDQTAALSATSALDTRVTALEALGAYKWTFATAAARAATVVTAADIGKVGYQTDIALEYKLLSQSGGVGRWGRIPDLTMTVPRIALAVPGVNAGLTLVGTSLIPNTGSQANRTIANTSKWLRLPRNGLSSAASLGAASVWFPASANVYYQSGIGMRRRYVVGVGAVSASMRWFWGFTSSTPAGNVDPNTFLNCLGIGISGAADTNLQLYYNDGAGTATKIDLGVNFNAPRSVNEGFIFDSYTFDGTSWSYQVENVNSGAVVSGTLSSDLPATTASLFDVGYATNNLESTTISPDISSLEVQLRIV